jgi:hypothetical protein
LIPSILSRKIFRPIFIDAAQRLMAPRLIPLSYPFEYFPLRTARIHQIPLKDSTVQLK